jgi:hypothetical protein
LENVLRFLIPIMPKPATGENARKIHNANGAILPKTPFALKDGALSARIESLIIGAILTI